MIAKKTWGEVRWMGLAYVLILELLLVMAILLWPSLRRGGSAVAEMMPAEFLRDMARRVMDPNDDIAYRAYMAVQMFFKGVNIVGVAAAVLLGTGLIARERENGTLEFLLARPVSRSRVLWDKFWVTAVVVVVPVFLTSWSAVPLSRIVDQVLPFWPVTIAAIHSSVFVLGVLTLTVLCSVIARTQVHAAFAIGATIIVQVAVFFVQDVRAGSLFRLSDFEVYGPVVAGTRGFVSVFFGLTVWIALAGAALYATADRQFRQVEL